MGENERGWRRVVEPTGIPSTNANDAFPEEISFI